jgi:hypothetical protein
MDGEREQTPSLIVAWVVRLVVGAVFLMNVGCGLSFLAWPDRYAAGFEIGGVPGFALVRGLGILFLMWNATYPPVILQPGRTRALFAVVLVQQVIGLAGEIWIWLALPAGHAALQATGLRFILFDGIGLLGMVAAFWLLKTDRRASHT